MSKYDKAVNRNFKRVERFEDKLSGEKTGRDLDYNDYAEWHSRMLLEPVQYLFMCGFSSIILSRTRQKSAGILSYGKDF